MVEMSPALPATILLFLFLAAASPSSAKVKPETGANVIQLVGPVAKSVMDKALVSPSVKVADVVEHCNAYNEDTSVRHFESHVLGYVTPWNSHGYDVAKTFGNKFTMISPVWLQVVPGVTNSNKYAVAGLHDVDQGWMRDVRSSGSDSGVRILPRHGRSETVHILHRSCDLLPLFSQLCPRKLSKKRTLFAEPGYFQISHFLQSDVRAIRPPGVHGPLPVAHRDEAGG